MTTSSLALTKLVRSPLLGRAGERLGHIQDVVARLAESGYPLVSGLVLRIGGRDVFVSTGEIARIEPGAVQLSVDRLDLRAFERRPREILLARDILGHHVINVNDAQLVYVSDVELAERENTMRVIGIDVGSRAMPERLLPRWARGFRSHTFLDWSTIEPLLAHVPTVRRRLPFRRLARLHPAELADMVEAASPLEGEEILRAVGEDRHLEADVFEELDTDYQVEFLRTRPEAEAAEILANMSADDAADLVLKLEEERRDRLLGRLPLAQLHKVRMLLGYNPQTAGGLMSPDFLAFSPDTAIGDALQTVRTSPLPADAVTTVYVVDSAGRLIGVPSVIELLRHEPSRPVAEAVVREPVVVHPLADIPEIALKMADFNLGALPVVDDQDRMIGAVAVDDLLEVMLPADWRAVVHSSSTGNRRRREPSAPDSL